MDDEKYGELITDSNHKVYKNGKYFYKIGSGNDHKTYKREYKLNKIVGVKSKLILGGETVTLRSLDMGVPHNNWDLILLPSILESINNFPKVENDKIYKITGERRKSFRCAGEWPKIVYNYGRKIGLDKNNKLLKDLRNISGKIFVGDFLVHRDPHLGNIVFNKRLEAKFIDWESGLVGSKDITRGILYNNINRGALEDEYKNNLLKIVFNSVEDVESFNGAILMDKISSKIFEINKIINNN